MEEKLNKAEKIAKEVLILSRNTLLVNLRFLDAALSQFEMLPIEESSMLTDGHFLLYNAKHVLSNFKDQKETVVRDYLHIVMHCVYRHMFMDPSLDRPLWDLACDIAVENVINELELRAAASFRESLQRADIDRFKKQCNMLTAEKIYGYLKSTGFDPKAAAEIRSRFYADNHEIWYMTDEGKADRFGIGQAEGENEEGAKSEEQTQTVLMAKADMNAAWKQISERMQTDILMFSNGRYGDAGSILQNLKEVNREKYDYTSFLKKFAVLGEAMKINDDEFDYIFYTYGLKLYEKMPLIEPLECKEVKRIKEFVIAIDTSGSVIGDLVQKFVQKTYNILKSTESFFSKINLHIIQCDTEIQEHVKITSQEEFDLYFKNMTLKGFGGNNEIALFNFVDNLIKEKEFTNLKGIIYFTDGYGIFPEKKPDYDVAFVFVNDRYEIPEVPPWVIKLILEPNDI